MWIPILTRKRGFRTCLRVLPGIASAAAFLFLVSTLPLAAQKSGGYTLESLYSKTVAGTILSTGKVVKVGYKGEPALLPRHPLSALLQKQIGKPAVLVETLFAVPVPRPSDPAAAAAEMAEIYGYLRAVGSLEGIEYWSASRNTLRTFYAESYRIENQESRVRMPDPIAPAPGSIPATETFLAFQRDLSFGSNVYKYTFTYQGEAFIVHQNNLTKMNYGLLPVINPGSLSTHLLIIRAEDAIVFYAESGADAPGILKGKLEVSFTNRAEALFRWFEGRVGK